MRSAMAASEHLTIVLHDTAVTIIEKDGARVTLQTDNRKVDERAENGLVKLTRKSRWDGLTLVSEIEIDKGPSLERKYELSPGGTELHVSTTVSGGFGGGGKRVIVQVYERPEEPAQ